MIAPYFVPRRRVGAIRPFKFSTHLHEFGWHPTLIAIKSNTGSLTKLEEELLKTVQVHELETPLDRTHKSGGQLGKSRAEGTPSISKIITEKVSSFIDRNFPIDTWLPFFYSRYNHIRDIARESKPDVIFSTGDPWSAHWVAQKLKKDLSLPWVADFRDPWTLSNVSLKERTAFSSSMDRFWEKKVMKTADWLTFTSRNTCSLYQGEYPFISDKSSTIYNAYDYALYEAAREKYELLNMEDQNLNIIFWGKFRKLSPVDGVIEILKAVKRTNPDIVKNIKIHSFGEISERDMELARGEGFEEQFIAHEPMPPESALSVLNQADIQLVSTAMERKDIIPAKLWDYLAADPPILSIAPNPEIRKILEETQSGKQYDLRKDIDRLVEVLVQCVNAKKNGGALPLHRAKNDEDFKLYDAESITKQLSELFEHLTSNKTHVR